MGLLFHLVDILINAFIIPVHCCIMSNKLFNRFYIDIAKLIFLLMCVCVCVCVWISLDLERSASISIRYRFVLAFKINTFKSYVTEIRIKYRQSK